MSDETRLLLKMGIVQCVLFVTVVSTFFFTYNYNSIMNLIILVKIVVVKL